MLFGMNIKADRRKLAIRVPTVSLADRGIMILFAVASPQDRLGDQRKEKMPEKLSELKISKE